MTRFGCLTFCWIMACATMTHAQDAALAIGWDGRSGPTLLGELNCLACHEGSVGSLPVKQAPILAEIGGRVTPQFLRAYLANPQTVKPGSAMPDLLHGLPANDRADSVEALTHYLVSLGGPIPQREAGASSMQIERGQALFHSVGCVACHAPIAAAPKQKKGVPGFDDDEPKAEANVKHAVPLGDLAMKTTLPALAKFLANPLHVRPSGRMPSLNLDAMEAEAIAAYLLREQMNLDAKALGQGLMAEIFNGSFKQVADLAKLTPTVRGAVRSLDLAAALATLTKKKTDSVVGVRFSGQIEAPRDGTYKFWITSDDGSKLFVDGKVVVDNDGTHPPTEKAGSVELKKGRHAFELGFFNAGGGAELTVAWQPPETTARESIPPGAFTYESASAMVPKGVVDFALQPALVQKGKAAFMSLGCASCHQVDAAKTPLAKLKAPALNALNPAGKGGCLDAAVQAGRPRFAFDAEQRAALQKTLVEWKPGVPVANAATALEQQMSALSCYACHVRDGKGGPDKARANYFTYEVLVDLGDEGRLPPHLTGVGAKLTTEGFFDALHSGKRYRSSMATRMPGFGKDNIGHLPELFAKVDEGKVAAHQTQFAPNMVEDGRKLTGRTTLACINCHAWGNLRLPGAEGLDLLQVPRRIRPEWFHAWLTTPNALRPGTRMPTAWPDGKSFFPMIQNGNVDRQMDAIWAYLKAGDKGGIPTGLGASDSKMLVALDEPIVFRTFLDKFGAHAILVGFPQRMHLAFDANRIRTAVAWSGDFISTKAAWEGRAGEYAPIPSSSIVNFPDGPPFAILASLTDAWPQDPPKKKGVSRTPAGWRFVGYRLDEKRNPTFLYKIGEIDVEETPTIESRAKGSVLVRRFRFVAATPPMDLFLRAADGKTIVPSDDGYRVDGSAEYRIVGGAPQIRAIGGKQELIAPIRFQPDAAKKANVADVAIEVAW